jgi:hypothetical protein
VKQFLRLQLSFLPEWLRPAARVIPLWVLPCSRSANLATKLETGQKIVWARN